MSVHFLNKFLDRGTEVQNEAFLLCSDIFAHKYDIFVCFFLGGK